MNAKLKSLSRCSTVLMLLPLASCVTNYQAPTSGATASLYIRAHSLQGHKYLISTFDEANTCTGKKQITSGEGPTPQMATLLRAGVPVTLAVNGTKNNSSCGHYLSFTPVRGAVYFFQSTVDETGCKSIVYQVENQQFRLPPDLLSRQPKADSCAPMSTAKKVSTLLENNKKPSLDDFKDLLKGQ